MISACVRHARSPCRWMMLKDRHKKAGISAGSAQRRRDRPVGIVDGNTCGDVRGGYGQRRQQFLERLYRSKTGEIFFHALVGSQSEPGWRPAAEIREARGGSNLGHFFQRCSGTVAHGDQGAHARASYAIDGNSSFAQDAEDTEVGNTAREAARKSQAHSWALPGFALLAVCEGAKFVLCAPKPAGRSGGFVLFRHFSSLALSPRIGPSFDPRMPVL